MFESGFLFEIEISKSKLGQESARKLREKNGKNSICL